jgi:hypothetical protein
MEAATYVDSSVCYGLMASPKELPTLEIICEDDCCTKHLQAANRTNLESWYCPECAEHWEWIMVLDVKYWYPKPLMSVMPLAR